MGTKSITIRKMTRAELDQAAMWAQDEGWNPGLHDTDVFWKTDSDGFLVLEADGEMIGTGSVVSYGGEFGFMGFFIIKKPLRGQGLGRQLWYHRRDFLRSRLQSGAPIGMDGVFVMQHFYAEGGFQLAHRDLRMEGTGRKLDFDARKTLPVAAAEVQTLLELDKRCFGYDRRQFVEDWVAMPESRTFRHVDDSGATVGWGTIRKCVKGWKIGPLFAKNATAAEEIFRALNTVAVDDPIYLDIPEVNTSALELAARHQMKECFGCARMYLGVEPKIPWDEVYGITTFELG